MHPHTNKTKYKILFGFWKYLKQIYPITHQIIAENIPSNKFKGLEGESDSI